MDIREDQRRIKEPSVPSDQGAMCPVSRCWSGDTKLSMTLNGAVTVTIFVKQITAASKSNKTVTYFTYLFRLKSFISHVRYPL